MMTAEQLKASILQMAMQGKLVEQRPEEGTGEELYKEIQAEKKRLLKEGTIKKQKPLSDITETEIPFDIPESWRWVRWGELSESIQYGYNAPAKETGRIRMVRISDIQDGRVLWDSVPYCDIEEESINSYLLEANDILFARTGGTVGKSYLVKTVPGESIYAGYLIRTRYSKRLCPEYMKYFMDSQLYWNQLRGGTIATAQPNCNGKTLSQMILPLPPLAEQKRIVEKIEELMPFVEQYAAASTKLNTLNASFPEMMKKSILQEAVQGKLVPQNPNDEPASVLLKKIAEEKKRLIKEGKIKKQKPLPEITEDEIPFDIPESWEWVRFSDIMNSISTGPFGSMLHKTDYENEGIPIVNPIHMQKGRIIPSSNSLISNKTAERLSSYKLQVGDIVLARRGDIGRSAVVHEAEGGWICGTGSFFATPSKGINPDFISLMFTTPYVRKALLGESVGTTMNNLNQRILLSFLFPIPPEKEQERILRAFDNVNRMVSELATIS